MASPVQLSDLPPIASPLSPSGILLYRSGFTDFQATLAQVQAILINALSVLGRPPQPTDLMIVQPSSGAASSQVYFGQVGLVGNGTIGSSAATYCWFWQTNAPMFWQSVGAGDTVLAVAGGSGSYNVPGGTAGVGLWQQPDVGGVAGQGLTVAQMPSHSHTFPVFSGQDGSNAAASGGPQQGTVTTSSQGSNTGTNGTSAAHNHGITWRPLASVGIICQKTS
jgi:hypothetical protein